MKIKVLIVDDEPLARKRIRDLLKNENDIEIAGEACNGIEAVIALEEKTPDLVFLDVQMPEMDGFSVIKTIGIEKIPHVIFVTAFDQYALDAFEVHALDYLLKPFDKRRFKKSLKRAIEYIELKNTNKFNDQLNALIEGTGTKYVERLIARSGGRYSFLKTDEIDWIGSAGNYLTLHSGNEKHVIRGSMKNMEQKLDPEKFIRIHRQTIVNIDCIKGFQHFFKGEYKVFLNNNVELTLGQVYREKFKERFKDSF
jgi:two-component system LytT family response regulator